VVKLRAFPISGRGLGPGGYFFEAPLWDITSRERVTTAPASVTTRRSTDIVGGENAKSKDEEIKRPGYITLPDCKIREIGD
jgi:hypothetical protein